MDFARRRILVAVSLLAALGLGGWHFAAPSRSAAAAPDARDDDDDVDLDSPADRARREAALALAVMPNTALAGSAPRASEAAASAAASPATCGVGDGPQFAQWTPPGDDTDVPVVLPQAIPTRGALPAWTAAQAAIAASLRASTDPFDQAVADALNVGDMRTPQGAVDALVQRAQSAGDARVYALAWAACQRRQVLSLNPVRFVPASTSCTALSAADWAALDPDNAIPWMQVLQDATAAHDDAAAQSAFEAIAQASRFDGRSAAAAEVAAHAAGAAGEEAAAFELEAGAAMAAFTGLSAAPVMQACRATIGVDARRVQQCLQIADSLYDRGDSALLHIQGGLLRYQMTGDPSRRDAARTESRRLGEQRVPRDDTECGRLHALSRYIARAAQIGDMAAMRELAASAATP